MRRILILLLLSTCCSLVTLEAQSSDAMNSLDENGRKTGYWIVKAAIKPTKGYKPEQIVEEGSYSSNKKEGMWKRYYPNGKTLSEITYASNIPNGAYKTYYETGVLEEQGIWNFNKNTGDFKRFHPNGKQSQEFAFNENGIRNGEQLYFHENGAVELRVKIVNGKEEGLMTRYFTNGDIKETKDFTGGTLEQGSISKYAMKKPEVLVKEAPSTPSKSSTVVGEDKPNVATFKASGKNTLYNKNLQVSQTGYFKNGRLWNGRWNKYSNDGLLEAIEVYKNGQFSGYGPLPVD